MESSRRASGRSTWVCGGSILEGRAPEPCSRTQLCCSSAEPCGKIAGMRALPVIFLALVSLSTLGCAGRQASSSRYLQPGYYGQGGYPGTPGAPGQSPAPPGAPVATLGAAPGAGASAAVTFAQSRVGAPYCWGGTGPSCYDCSGLTSSAWLYGGKKIPRTSSDQLAELPAVPMDSLAPGDILWRPGHVAIYVGQGWVISAPGRGDVVKYQSTQGYSRAVRP